MSLMRGAVLRPTKGIKKRHLRCNQSVMSDWLITFFGNKNVNIRQARPNENAKDGVWIHSLPTKKPSFHADYWDMRQYTNILVY